MLAMTLRPPVRGAGRDRREGRADGERVQGGGQLHRDVGHRRLLALHRARLRHGGRARAAGEGGRLRLLAALPLRPAPGRRRARARSSSTARRRRSTSPGSSRTRPASGRSRRRTPRAFKKMMDAGAEGRAREVRALRAARARDEPGEPRPGRRPGRSRPRRRRRARAGPTAPVRSARAGAVPFFDTSLAGRHSPCCAAPRRPRRIDPGGARAGKDGITWRSRTSVAGEGVGRGGAARPRARCGRGGGAKGAAAQREPVTLSPENVAVVEERTLRSGPGISGTLRARREAVLRAEVGGAVLEVLAEAGERVRPGQLLARIDDAALQDALLAARSGVVGGEERACRSPRRTRSGRGRSPRRARSPRSRRSRRSPRSRARGRSSPTRRRASSLAEQQVGKTRVRAPFAGVVARRQVSVGRRRRAGRARSSRSSTPRGSSSRPRSRRRGSARCGPARAVDFAVTGFERERFEGDDRAGRAGGRPRRPGRCGSTWTSRTSGAGSSPGSTPQGRVAARRVTGPAAPLAAVDATSKPADGDARLGRQGREGAGGARAPRRRGGGGRAHRRASRRGDVLVLGSARATLAEGAPVRARAGEPARRGAAAGSEGRTRRGGAPCSSPTSPSRSRSSPSR